VFLTPSIVRQAPDLSASSDEYQTTIADLADAQLSPWTIDRAHAISAATVALCGDLNHEGVVDISDEIIMLKVTVGLIKPTSIQAELGDLNGDDTIDVFDAIMTLQHIVGLPSAGISQKSRPLT